jgi:predicted RNase H-like nuclease (RuvC/YqgF family)
MEIIGVVGLDPLKTVALAILDVEGRRRPVEPC